LASKVLTLGKVLVTPDMSIMKVMFVQILGSNLISLVREIAIIGFATFFDIDIVILM
jgi:hypothetical protein